MTSVAMRNGIVLKASKTDEDLIELLTFCQADTDFTQNGKQMPNADTWWPYPMFRSRFMLQYNLRFGALGNSLYSRSEYLFQLLPCLEFRFALRKAFGVPAGVGRILNADEVMTYRYDPSTRCWKF